MAQPAPPPATPGAPLGRSMPAVVSPEVKVPKNGRRVCFIGAVSALRVLEPSLLRPSPMLTPWCVSEVFLGFWRRLRATNRLERELARRAPAPSPAGAGHGRPYLALFLPWFCRVVAPAFVHGRKCALATFGVFILTFLGHATAKLSLGFLRVARLLPGSPY